MINNLPKTWTSVKVIDVAGIITGNTPPKENPENYGAGIPFVKPPELTNSAIYSAPDSLSEVGMKLARQLPVNAVLVSCIGALGKTGIAKVPVVSNQQINALVFSEVVLPEYGFYYFQTPIALKFLNSVSSATTISIVNKSKFSQTPLPLAPLFEQQRIVDKIEELFTDLDAGVVALKKSKALIKKYRQSVLKAAFEGKLTESWRNKNKVKLEPAVNLLNNIVAIFLKCHGGGK